MARRPKREERPLLPPLPPAQRTVGQLVAESIRMYGRHFLHALPLGVVVAAINQLTVGVDRITAGAALLAVAPVFSAGFAYACRIETDTPAPRRSWVIAIAVGTLIWIPAAILFPLCRRPATSPVRYSPIDPGDELANPLWGAPRIHGELLSSGSTSDKPRSPNIWRNAESRLRKDGEHFCAIMPMASRQWICLSFRP